MRPFLLALYSLWTLFWFTVLYLLIFPFQFICLQRESWKMMAQRLNRWCVLVFFFITGVPVRVSYQGKPLDNQSIYIFCANHFSFLDIPVMAIVVEPFFAFVGKSGVTKIPFFGYMFAKLHIEVDRENARSGVKAFQKSLRALTNGQSLIIFPEGGMRSKNPPKLHREFKDGAFKMAIEKQVPIVPVTQLNNYQLMPDVPKIRFHPGVVRVIIHEPIDTKGMTASDIEPLKNQVYQIISHSLQTYSQNPKEFVFKKLGLL